MASTSRCFPLGLVLLCVLPGVAPADDCLSYADHLRWVGGVVLPEGSNRVAVSGTHAYVVGAFGLKVVDISDPNAPVIVGGTDTPAFGHDIAISGMFAYVADVVHATRRPAAYGLADLAGLVAFGASPRASIALIRAARAHAFLRHRGYVTPDDIKAVGLDVLRHRVLLTYEAQAEEVAAEQVISRVFDTVEAP